MRPEDERNLETLRRNPDAVLYGEISQVEREQRR